MSIDFSFASRWSTHPHHLSAAPIIGSQHQQQGNTAAIHSDEEKEGSSSKRAADPLDLEPAGQVRRRHSVGHPQPNSSSAQKKTRVPAAQPIQHLSDCLESNLLQPPLITVPGGVKRKLQMEANERMMPNAGDEFRNEFIAAKQGRYEDRISSGLWNIHLLEEQQTKKQQAERTITGGGEGGGCAETGMGQQQSRPHIREIENWEEHLLESEEDLIRAANSAPIIEEPVGSPTGEESGSGSSTSARKRPAQPESMRIEEVEESGEDQNGGAEGDQQRIVLSDELQQLIHEFNQREKQCPLPARPLRSGRELVPYVPALSLFPSSLDEGPQIEEINQPVDEILDEEVLPDETNTPRVDESASESDLPTPPPPAEAMDEQEETMEVD